MTTLDKLRALHREVCLLYRAHHDGDISEGEAELLNLGFIILEDFVEKRTADQEARIRSITEIAEKLAQYYQRVHSQFDSDADIVIKGE